MPPPIHKAANKVQNFRMRGMKTMSPDIENAVFNLDGSAKATDFCEIFPTRLRHCRSGRQSQARRARP